MTVLLLSPKLDLFVVVLHMHILHEAHQIQLTSLPISIAMMLPDSVLARICAPKGTLAGWCSQYHTLILSNVYNVSSLL